MPSGTVLMLQSAKQYEGDILCGVEGETYCDTVVMMVVMVVLVVVVVLLV